MRLGMRFSWLPCICVHREVCKTCCFKLVTPDGDIILRFIFALQSPHNIGFFRMWRIGASDQCCAHGAGQFVGRWQHVFKYDWENVIYSEDCLIDEAWPVHVLLDCVDVSKGLMVSDSDWVSLSECQQWVLGGAIVADKSHSEVGVEEPPLTEGVDVFVACPWLLDWKHWNHLEPHCVNHAGPKAPCSLATSTSSHGNIIDLDFSELCNDAFVELEAARKLAPGPEADALTDVRVFPRTGEWTLLRHGVAGDSWWAEVAHVIILHLQPCFVGADAFLRVVSHADGSRTVFLSGSCF